jgi:hypothetical protein
MHMPVYVTDPPLLNKAGCLIAQYPCATDTAPALSASPKAASAIPASPTPNFFSAPRRVTDWAGLFVS